MKYLKKHIAMETIQLPSLQMWLGHELESRGIDSMIYSRYIIQLLQQDDDEQDCSEFYDFMYGPKIAVDTSKFKVSKTGKRRTEKRKPVNSTEDRKKSAAIECLQAVSEEDSGIEILVEELCSKLREINISGTETIPTIKSSSSCTSDDSDSSSPELADPAERYYAAFPALKGQDQSISKDVSSPYNQDAVYVWKNNPITNNAGDNAQTLADSGNESEKESFSKSLKIRKIDEKVSMKSPCPYAKSRKKKSPKPSRKPKEFCSKNCGSITDHPKISRYLSWPQDQQCNGKKLFEVDEPVPNGKEKDLCYQVEYLLKEMLLPVSGSPYLYPSDLAGSEYGWDDACIRPRPPCNLSESQLSSERISPELQEKEIWYTQPLDNFFTPDKACHQRLYKRHSCPSFEQIGCYEIESSVHPSTLSDPVEKSPADGDSFGLQTLMICPENSEDFRMSPYENTSSSENGQSPCRFITDASLASHNYMHTLNNQSFGSGVDCFSEPTYHSNSHEQCNDVFQPTPALSLFYTSHHSDSINSGSTSSLHSSTSGNTVTGKENDKQISNKDTHSLWDNGNLFVSSFKSHLNFDSFSRDSVFRKKFSYDSLGTDFLSKSKCKDAELETAFSFQNSNSNWSYDYENKRLTVGTEASQLWDVKCQKRLQWEAVCPWKPNETFDLNIDSNSALSFSNSGDTENLSFNQNGTNTSTNTLIPVITFALVSDEEIGENNFTDDETDDDVIPMNNSPPKGEIDRSISLNELQLVFSLNDQSSPNPQLSKSFELVPSERSAFDDVVPRRLFHVRSEPDLKQYYKEGVSKFSEGRSKYGNFMQDMKLDHRIDKKDKDSPEEHLYYSSKTHFQPIQGPEDKHNHSGSEESLTDFHLRDLFGGYSKTSKTPYQKYQDHGSDSGEETFVPMFRICEEHDKYIQTNTSPEPDAVVGQLSDITDICSKCGNICLQSPDFDAVAMSENQGCVCLDLFQYVHEDFDINGYIDSLTASEQNTPQNIPDNQNTCSDSGYEDFEVGGSVNESRQIARHTKTSDTAESKHVPVLQNFEYVTLEKESGEKEVFSQENGWIMYQMENKCEERNYDDSNVFVDGMTNQVMLGLSKDNMYCVEDIDDAHDYHWPYNDCWSSEGATESLPKQGRQNRWRANGGKSANLNYQEVEFSYFENSNDCEEMHNTLENETDHNNEADQMNSASRISVTGPIKSAIDNEEQNFNDSVECENEQNNVHISCSKDLDSVTVENVLTSWDNQLSAHLRSTPHNMSNDCDNIIGTFSSHLSSSEQARTVIFDTHVEKSAEILPKCGQEPEDDVVKIRLVFHKGRSMKSDTTGHSHHIERDLEFMQTADTQNFMPMPSKAVYSTDLEKEWLNGKQFPPDSHKKIQKSGLSCKGSKKKPCTFFMEGNCRRVDCKFAHDLSVITCRFWEEGECFKSDMCPFLHGYYSDADGLSCETKETFDYKADDFPDLAAKSKDAKNKTKNSSLKKIVSTSNDSKAQYLNSRKMYRRSTKTTEKSTTKSQMDRKSGDKTSSRSLLLSLRHSEVKSEKKKTC